MSPTASPPTRVLLVEDNPGDARLVVELLAALGPEFEVEPATSLMEALRALRSAIPDVALVDLSLPDSMGLGTILALRAEAPDLPLVVLTGLEDETVALAALQEGAQDYLVKGRVDPAALVRSIRFAIRRARAAQAGHVARPAEGARQLDLLEAEHKLLLRLLGQAAAPARVADRIEVGATLAGRYELGDVLGEGVSGRAYLATDATLGRRVVVKVLRAFRGGDDGVVRKFLREARVAANLEHPNVIRIYDFGYLGEAPYLVMEYAPSGSLAALLEERGPLPEAEVVRIGSDVLAGLHYMHRQGVLHRDVKPANILLAADGTAKLADFGLAFTVGGPADPARGAFGGTPAYVSPESARGDPVTRASDLYSVGALLHHCLSGDSYVAFRSADPDDVRAAIAEDPPRALPKHVSAGVRGVVRRALEKDPADRFATAAEMASALAGLTPGGGGRARRAR